jgi:glycosyltransferase involved in cell wall biosynthesis
MVVLSHYPNDPRVRREAEALARNHIGVDIICMRGPGEERVTTWGPITAYRVLKSRNKESLLAYLLISVQFTLLSFLVLQRLSLRNKYQLVQVHNMPDYLVLACLWKKLRGIPVILDLHDLMVELFDARWSARKARILSPLVRFVEKWSCRFANHLITTSVGFRDCLTRRGVNPEKITLVLNSADNRIFQRQERAFARIDREATILYHGTVAPRFGLHVAIKAVGLLQKQLPGSRFHIYGEYDPGYRSELECLVHAEGLEKHVVLGAYQSLKEMVRIIRAADIGLVPYLSDPFMDIALSTKLFEYVAMGLPVVASRLPSATSIFSDACVRYFAPGNARDLADQIHYVCTHPEWGTRSTECASSAYEAISWPVMEERYVNLVQRAVEQK